MFYQWCHLVILTKVLFQALLGNSAVELWKYCDYLSQKTAIPTPCLSSNLTTAQHWWIATDHKHTQTHLLLLVRVAYANIQ